MKNKIDLLTIVIIILSLMCALAFGSVIGSNKRMNQIQEKAIEEGYAKYHPKTGEIVWKDKTLGKIMKKEE